MRRVQGMKRAAAIALMMAGCLWAGGSAMAQESMAGGGAAETETWTAEPEEETQQETQRETAAPLAEDFKEWYEANPDTIGWLRIDGTVMDYPVVQSDNEFYLHHDFYGRDDINGTLFIDEMNGVLPRDKIVLIYGHHMRDGSMFGSLMQYESFDYTCRHPLISFRTIYDEEEVFYTPAAGFNASMTLGADGFFDLLWPFYDDEYPIRNGETWVYEETEAVTEAAAEESESEPESGTETESAAEPESGTEAESAAGPESGAEAESAAEPESGTETETEPPTEDPAFHARKMAAKHSRYVEVLQEMSIWKSPAGLTADDDLLILVTCSYYHENGRFLLVCRKLREDETPEGITQLFAQSGGIM